jgi:L-ascorbate metabolism protein UlaG (beta-lactamase superfamily)
LLVDITWLGRGCFRIKHRDMTLILDPLGGPGAPRSLGEADIVTISHDHPEHANSAAVSGAPRVITGPGEYEIGGVLITGVQTFHDSKRGAERGRNTVFVFELDEVKVCHLGDIGHVPTVAQAEQLNDCAVLLVPVGGHTTLDAVAAVEVVSMLEPRVVVPMHYGTSPEDGALDPLEKFIKQMGAKDPQPAAKLTISRTNLPIETTITVLERR